MSKTIQLKSIKIYDFFCNDSLYPLPREKNRFRSLPHFSPNPTQLLISHSVDHGDAIFFFFIKSTNILTNIDMLFFILSIYESRKTFIIKYIKEIFLFAFGNPGPSPCPSVSPSHLWGNLHGRRGNLWHTGYPN